MVSTLLLAGCSATTSEAGGQAPSANVSESPAKKLSPIEKVREADPDNLGKGLIYKVIAENKQGKYVALGADPKSSLSKFDQDAWSSTGDNWSKSDMAKIQLDAADFFYDTMLSGTAIGGDKSDRNKQADATLKRFNQSGLSQGGGDEVRGVYEGPDNRNPFTIFADPVEAKFEGYEIYQDAGSSRYLNPVVTLQKAESHNEGDTLEDGTIANINGATVEIAAVFDLKLTKDGKTFTKPTQLSYGVFFAKIGDDIGISGVNILSGDFDNKPTEAAF